MWQTHFGVFSRFTVIGHDVAAGKWVSVPLHKEPYARHLLPSITQSDLSCCISVCYFVPHLFAIYTRTICHLCVSCNNSLHLHEAQVLTKADELLWICFWFDKNIQTHPKISAYRYFLFIIMSDNCKQIHKSEATHLCFNCAYKHHIKLSLFIVKFDKVFYKSLASGALGHRIFETDRRLWSNGRL